MPSAAGRAGPRVTGQTEKAPREAGRGQCRVADCDLAATSSSPLNGHRDTSGPSAPPLAWEGTPRGRGTQVPTLEKIAAGATPVVRPEDERRELLLKQTAPPPFPTPKEIPVVPPIE